MSVVTPKSSSKTESKLAKDKGKALASPLKNPSMARWRPRYRAQGPAHRKKPLAGFEALAVANGFDLPIYEGFQDGTRHISGRTFRGSAFSVRSAQKGCDSGSQRGTWYRISTKGHYVCSADGYEIKKKNGHLEDQRDPDLSQPEPFSYARVVEEGAVRLKRLPRTQREIRILAERQWNKAHPPEWVAEVMRGDYFLSLDKKVRVLGQTFYRTVRGEFVRADMLKLQDRIPLRGEFLEEGLGLPIAFVAGEEAIPIKCKNDDETLSPCGQANKHDRLHVEKIIDQDEGRYVVGEKGFVLPRSKVRIAEKRERPPSIGQHDKWIHVDLSEQTLVAYEGSKPVFATLTSSGKKDYDTPKGLYRIKRKYTTKIMRGKDKKDGRIYHIEDVPWIMYYYGSYAVHGAYWHNTFGNVRSHGCTNLAPADARWLFHWTDPEVKWGWHARFVNDGTFLLFES